MKCISLLGFCNRDKMSISQLDDDTLNLNISFFDA